MKKRWIVGALVLAIAAALAATVGRATRASAAPKLTKITLQLKWVPQAQFAGYYAASLKGFYKAQGLDVTLKNGGPDIIPEQVVASGQAQFGVDWLPSLLAARDKGTDLVNVAQVFARSGMTQLTWKSSGINSIAKMKGKKVANWLGGNQYELFAALDEERHGPGPEQGRHDRPAAVRHEPVPEAPGRLGVGDDLQRARPGARVEEPEDGQALQLSDLNVLKMQNVGTGMLEDGLFSTGSWLKSPANQAIAVKFIAASLQGWIYCRDHQADCVKMTLQEGPTLPAGPPDLADERDQQADLAEHGRRSGS